MKIGPQQAEKKRFMPAKYYDVIGTMIERTFQTQTNNLREKLGKYLADGRREEREKEGEEEGEMKQEVKK